MDFNLSAITCAINSFEDEHLCEIPVILLCGHYICKNCMPTGNQKIKCSICNMINNVALNTDIKHQAFNDILNLHLNQLFTMSFEKLDNVIKTFNQIVINNDESIDNHVQFTQEDIEIYIESIKIRLDDIYESFIKQLEEIKIKWKSENKKMEFDIEKYKNELKELEKIIKNQQNLTKDNLYYYQQQIRTIQKTINKLNNGSPKITFLSNEYKISEDFVGKLEYEGADNLKRRHFDDIRIKQKIKANNFESFDIGFSVRDISELPNGNVLVISFYGCIIKVYNKNKEHIKTVTDINNKEIKIMGVATDGIDKIYLSDCKNSFIIKTDLELNHLLTSDYGRPVTKFTGLYFFNQFLYGCDEINKRIVKLDPNLVYQASFELNYAPCYIKIMNNLAMIRAYPEPFIYFYDLNSFTVRKKYEGHNGIIGVSKECFYEFYFKNKVFYCYDKNGELIEEIQTNGLNLSNEGKYGAIFTYNSDLYLGEAFSDFVTIISSG